MDTKVCSLDNCTGRVRGRGWCGKHWQRWRKYGDPTKTAWEKGNTSANFWAKVDCRGPGECWPWTAYVDKDGYGHFSVWVGTKQDDTPAHRFAYEQVAGPIPPGLHMDHLCHGRDESCPGGPCQHRRCVNPTHLEPVLPIMNSRRGLTGQPQARIKLARTHCPSGHPFDEVNTQHVRRGDKTYRRCITCDRARGRKKMAARRAAAKQAA